VSDHQEAAVAAHLEAVEEHRLEVEVVLHQWVAEVHQRRQHHMPIEYKNENDQE
jgi:hypothetical protein